MAHGLAMSPTAPYCAKSNRPRGSRKWAWSLEPGAYVLFLGRFSPEKNCHLLIEAFEQIDTPVKLVLAGGGRSSDPYSQELRRHASDRIVLLDYVAGNTFDELLTNAILFVLPSDLEGLRSPCLRPWARAYVFWSATFPR